MIKSPLGQLRSVIRQVAESADTHRMTLSQNEAFTRMALVDKILAALGWDLSDSGMVIVEYHVPQIGRLDYALFGPDTPGVVRKPMAVVEAKRLGGNLQENSHQIIAYAIGMQIENVFLTDGMIWSHYSTPFTGPDTHYTVDFSVPDPSEGIAYLMHVLDAALAWPDQTDEDIRGRISSMDTRLRAMEEKIHRITEVLAAQKAIEPSLVSTTHTSEIEQSENVTFDDLLSMNLVHSKPRFIVFDDADPDPVNDWMRFLERCAWHAVNRGARKLPIPFGSGHQRYIVNTQKVHRSGKEMVQPRQIDSPDGLLFVETHNSAHTCVTYARKLFEVTGLKEPRVKLR